MISPDLDQRLDALRTKDELSGATLDAFKAFLGGASDQALFRMSPLRYAIDHGLPEQEGIDLFLHATHAGILEFAWGVLCPGCLAFLTTAGGLRSLDRKKHCNFCNIDIDGSIDDRVEVAFTVAPTVRRIRFHTPDTLDLHEDGIRLYFSSSLAPESAPHAALQRHILVAGRAPPGVVHEARVTLAEGETVLLTPTSHAVVYLRAAPQNQAREVSMDLLDGHAIPDSFDVATGRIELRIRNRTAHPVSYIVSPAGSGLWPMPAPVGSPLTIAFRPYLTGQRLVSTQTFRDLFRAESIPSDGGLELKAVTVLFTDLQGSTAIYERVGDLRAYDLVRRHFAALRAIAAAEGGAIVKTIGDAVMASFADPLSAMRAAVRMRHEIAALGEGDLRLKIGLHSGPCIAVELNERLDYFGRTVNIAARVQGLAGAGEIVCSDIVYSAAGVSEVVAAAGLLATSTSVSLRGIAGDVPVVRLAPAAVAHGEHR
jgi:class 3 adenylate cyclase